MMVKYTNEHHKLSTTVIKIIYINYYFSTTYYGHFPLRHGGKYVYFCKT